MALSDLKQSKFSFAKLQLFLIHTIKSLVFYYYIHWGGEKKIKPTHCLTFMLQDNKKKLTLGTIERDSLEAKRPFSSPPSHI